MATSYVNLGLGRGNYGVAVLLFILSIHCRAKEKIIFFANLFAVEQIFANWPDDYSRHTINENLLH